MAYSSSYIVNAFGQYQLWDSVTCPDYRGFLILELVIVCIIILIGTDLKALSSLERITGNLLYGASIYGYCI